MVYKIRNLKLHSSLNRQSE